MTDLATLETRFTAFELAMHRKLDAIVTAVHHLMTRSPDMDHTALLALAKTIDGDVDTAVGNYQALQASHDTVTGALDDVGDVLNGIPAKLAKIAATAPTTTNTDTSATSSTATIVAAVTAPATVLPVSTTDATAAASTLSAATAAGTTATISGPGIAAGTTVTSVDATAPIPNITLSTPTTADHTGDGTERLTVTAPSATS